EDVVRLGGGLAAGRPGRPGLCAPEDGQVTLGRAVVDLEPGRITVAGRRVAVADQRNVTAADKRGPSIPLISDSPHRRGDQPKGKRGERQTAHVPRLLGPSNWRKNGRTEDEVTPKLP